MGHIFEATGGSVLDRAKRFLLGSPRAACSNLAVGGGCRIPQDVLELLWFTDGPFKNYAPDQSRSRLEFQGFVIEVSLGSDEPSAISLRLPVAKNVEWDLVPDPPYYPSYARMTPEQRRKYLEWLPNVDENVNPGYVFVFYYGLERHLFFGEFDRAFDMVLRLRRAHTNSSFQHYSSAALIAAAAIHHRPDLVSSYIAARALEGQGEVSNLALLAKAALNLGLTSDEIMAASKAVGFRNQRYIKEQSYLFRAHLDGLLRRDFGGSVLPLDRFSVRDYPSKPELIAANYSFEKAERDPEIPCLFMNERFREVLSALLEEAHEGVKSQLKEMRKRGVPPGVAIVPQADKGQTPD